MRESSSAGLKAESRQSSRYWLHLVDNLFRRLPLFLLPIIVMVLIGGVLAQRSSAEYSSRATLDASNNPLLDEIDVRGSDPIFRQTNAESTASFINEQLRTDVFATAIAEAAGLGDAIDAGLIGTDTIRGHVSSQPNGDSIIVVRATWSDPTTAQLLVEGTIDSYRDYVISTVASDSLAAEEFYTVLQQRAQSQLDLAEAELNGYVDALPELAEGEERSTNENLTIERLSNAVDRAETSVDDATREIETAQLQVAQSRSDAGQSVRIIDSASIPFAPEPRLFAMVSIVGMFTILGLLISASALFVTTALDHTIRFDIDAIAVTNSSYVATIPNIKGLDRTGRMRRLTRRSRKRKRDRDAQDDGRPAVSEEHGDETPRDDEPSDPEMISATSQP
jgi:hypothetical protein